MEFAEATAAGDAAALRAEIGQLHLQKAKLQVFAEAVGAADDPEAVGAVNVREGDELGDCEGEGEADDDGGLERWKAFGYQLDKGMKQLQVLTRRCNCLSAECF